MKRLSIEITGQVQGVGFRPYVYRLAAEFGLTGWVRNDGIGVSMEVQGKAMEAFLKRLQKKLPPMAKIDAILHCAIPLNCNETKFLIEKSQQSVVSTNISPDTAVCDDCLEELFDPSSAYYRYPFISCAHCGPRYTLSQQLPYDREATSMSVFEMCVQCRHAYKNPQDRRYHAQTVACNACGPCLSASIKKIVQAIAAGKIIALKGLGGYQLICDASNPDVIARLRKSKQRPKKPFALMRLNILSARSIVQVSSYAEKLLISKERPIVLLPKNEANLPEDIAPNLSELGVMLPYMPIHYLLFHGFLGRPSHSNWLHNYCDTMLVVTSANIKGCPLIKDNAKAKEQLSTIADIIVDYNREIQVRVDDSVIRPINNKACFIRRARGFVPRAISLPYEIPSTLALGGYLKNTICVTRGREAFLSQHIGDLSNRDSICVFRDTVKQFLKFLAIKPQCVAHDLHPEFYSTQMATEFNLPNFSIQHHQAHLAACAVEHQLQEEAIGLALDGFGLGIHHDNWGGELFRCEGTRYKRIGSLKPIRQPGGDIAAKQPWRMAASILFELGKSELITQRFTQEPQAKSILQLLEKKCHSPLTSSCGRLFDAASALLNICKISSYEGQAAMALESQVTQPVALSSGWLIESNQLNVLPLFKQLLQCDPVEGANLFHGTLGAAIVDWLIRNAKELHVKHVLLSGGCFLNKILSEWVIDELKSVGLIPLFPIHCPPNDGGISLGQAWIAGNEMLAAIPVI